MGISYYRIIKVLQLLPFLAIGDGLSTIWGLLFGGKEANFLPAFVIKNWAMPGFIIYEVLIFLIFFFIFNCLIIRQLKSLIKIPHYVKILHLLVILLGFAFFIYWLVVIIMNFIYPINIGFVTRTLIQYLITLLSAFGLVYYTRNEFSSLVLSIFENNQ